jgi:hypothetical protein
VDHPDGKGQPDGVNPLVAWAEREISARTDDATPMCESGGNRLESHIPNYVYLRRATEFAATSGLTLYALRVIGH